MEQPQDRSEQPKVLAAAERAMESVNAALDALFRGDATEHDTMMAVARISGAYNIERIA